MPGRASAAIERGSAARDRQEKAAASGDTIALTNIGLLHANRRGVQRDCAKAREWYEKYAAGGIVIAMRNLARLCENGQGADKDPAKGKKWMDKAASAEAAAN